MKKMPSLGIVCCKNAKWSNIMDGTIRNSIKPGMQVQIVLKADQRSGKRTPGVVKSILTKSSSHPHGIKVRLESGEVGRVQEIVSV